MTELIDKMKLLQQIADFGREIPKDQVMEVIARMEAVEVEALKQVTSKLNNPDDSLLTADPEACKEQKSKLDLISRQDAINTLKRVAGVGNRAIDALKNMPTMDRPRPIDPTITVDLESEVVSISACETKGPKTIVYVDRPKGKWVSKEGVYGAAYCSECNYELRVNNTNFCPNCGADMRGEDK